MCIRDRDDIKGSPMLCLECNKDVKALTNQHLMKCCGLTLQEYALRHCIPLDILLDYENINNNDERFGVSLFKLMKKPKLNREIMCEYHATGSISASYMLRKGDFKYILYLGYGCELYNVKNDPEELNNLSLNDEYQDVIKRFDKILRKHVDPEKMDLKAKSDQKLLIDYYGGREKIAKKKVASATPAPI